MSMLRFCFLVFSCIFFYSAHAQLVGYVRGVSENDTLSLNGAKLKLLANKTAVFTDSEGKFELFLGKKLPDTLVITYPGYAADTVVVDKSDRFGSLIISLYNRNMQPEVIVELKKQSGILKFKTLNIELLSSNEFRRAACCNLSESFETNASVDVNITDGVSGAKKIQLLGLDGVYTQFQFENIPFLRGLETPFGIQSLSGIWLSSIQISKGTGSVVNGHESMAGLINLELKQPHNMEKFLLNGYQNRFGRSEINALVGKLVGEKWATNLLTNGSYNHVKVDENKDGFMDIPLFRNLAVMNRWQYEGEKMEAQFGVNAYVDNRVSGQYASDLSGETYTMNAGNKHVDLFAKTGFFGKKPAQSLGVIYHAKYHELEGMYGTRNFQGTEKRAFVSMVYDDANQKETHKFRSGLTGSYLALKQQIGNVNRDREEFISSAFIEHNLNGLRFSLISGFRLDYHSLTGWQWVPRIHGKYALTPKMDLRFTAGKGWRIPNVLIDNIGLLANQKNWILPTQLLPEVSWNCGGSFVAEGIVFKKKFTWTTDVYYTWFERQLVIDRDLYAQDISFAYQENASSSMAVQTEISAQLAKNFELRLAYKYLDVKSIFGNIKQSQSMISKHRFLVTSNLMSKNKRWQWDLTAAIFGPMRMPASYVTMTYSPWYTLVNSQVIHKWKKWEVYLGVENALNYRQPNPILLAQNHQDPGFDATMVWGPITGINVYSGFRFAIKDKH
ncbi:MAG: TonB-dependent receptor [Flavobacteriia bacterium]|nr:TonB-dependent receptor [Flavobacteriia bacterium]NBV91971.1 TonB-dependent receptor [Flavobacteriia bacterium]NBY39462.1 TonB-dependent receptor [Flavobacteriia bacterium]